MSVRAMDLLDPARDAALEALILFLEREPERMKGRTEVLFLRARYHPELREALAGRRLVPVQTHRSDWDSLDAAGWQPTLEPEGPFDMVLYLGSPQREENLYNFARGLSLLRPEGLLVCSVPNELGAGRYEEVLASVAPLEFTFSKRKCRVFGIRRPAEPDPERQAEWLAKGEFRVSERTGLVTVPGLFGWDKVDEGSRLLADTLPEELPGAGADVGAGVGYLSRRILGERRGMKRLDLFEADRRGLDAARRNLEGLGQGVRIGYHWQDVVRGLPPTQYDWIVMNPPFHQGRARSLGLGIRFVEAAAGALRAKGVLHMVANRNLPYEAELEQLFARVERGEVREGFKVLRAWR